MRHWSEFQPRSLCSFSDGGPDGSSSDGSSSTGSDTAGSDTSGFFSGTSDGQTSGDFFGGGGFQGTNDAGSFISSSDTTGGANFADTTGGGFAGDQPGGQYFSSDTGGGYYGGDTTSGFNFSGDTPTGGSYFDAGPQAGPQGWGDAGWGQHSNVGLNSAIGPPGWATGDYGTYGTGGPTGTGLGPGAGPSIGGPQAYSNNAPGITGFAGDFGAPPGGTFGMPTSQGDVGPQAGPGMPGGPGNVGNAEPGFLPGGPQVGPETTPAVVPTDQRGENYFGPPGAETASSFFGPGSAQAASRGTDTQAIMAQSDPFAQVAMMANQVAQSNPALAEALMGIAANQNNQTNMVGPMMMGFEGPSPSAQQGFTGMSPAQQSSQGFTGQPSLSGVSPFTNDQAQGKGDRGDTNPAYQMSNADIIGGVNAAQNAQQQAAMQQAGPYDAQALGEQGRGPTPMAQQADTFDSRFGGPSPNQTVSDAFDALAGRGPGLPQSEFDSRFALDPTQFDTRTNDPTTLSPTPNARSDTFDSRFGNPSQFQPTPDTFASRFGDWGPQSAGLPPPGQVGPSMTGAPPPGQVGPGMVMADPNVTPGQQQFGDPILGAQRSADETRSVDPAIIETIARAGPELTTGLIGPLTQGVGREAAPLGLWGMMEGGRTGASPFGPPGGRSGSDTGRPGLAITVGNNQYAPGRSDSSRSSGRGDPGYYMTGGRGIAPGAKGAEYGGIYGPGVATGRPGTGTFGVSSREGAYGFFDPATGRFYR